MQDERGGYLRIIVVLLDKAHVKTPIGGLVNRFDGGNDVALRSITRCEGIDRGFGLQCTGVGRLPTNITPTSGIIEPLSR